MSEFTCPYCGKGKMSLEVVPKHITRLKGVPVVVENARISKCPECSETSVNAKELKRWHAIQQAQLQAKEQVPSASEVKRIRNALGLSISDFATILGVTRQTVHAWEHSETGGMQLGPAAILINILNEEIAGRVKGVYELIISASQNRGQMIRSGIDTKYICNSSNSSARSSHAQATLRERPSGAPGFGNGRNKDAA
ncbi:MAG: type II TA system antitoxin MqsA family protein [Planctomycetota bacterium]|jgi:putative zinc finger/helix-turn-helix YgiT family protein